MTCTDRRMTVSLVIASSNSKLSPSQSPLRSTPIGCQSVCAILLPSSVGSDVSIIFSMVVVVVALVSPKIASSPVLSRSSPWTSSQYPASLLNFSDCGLDAPAKKVYAMSLSQISDLDLDLTNQLVSPSRLCFRLCPQVVGVLGLRAPILSSMLSSMRAC